MNKLPQLKSFLKEENGVDLYRDVEVRFISGRKAVMTIYEDGKEQERITLSDYDDKDKLHALFKEKGFAQYTDVEYKERRKMKEEEEKKNNLQQASQTRSLRPTSVRGRPQTAANPKLRKREMKERLKQLKEARENFMTVGQPIG